MPLDCEIMIQRRKRAYIAEKDLWNQCTAAFSLQKIRSLGKKIQIRAKNLKFGKKFTKILKFGKKIDKNFEI